MAHMSCYYGPQKNLIIYIQDKEIYCFGNADTLEFPRLKGTALFTKTLDAICDVTKTNKERIHTKSKKSRILGFRGEITLPQGTDVTELYKRLGKITS